MVKKRISSASYVNQIQYPNIKILFHEHLVRFPYLPGTDYTKWTLNYFFYLIAWPTIGFGAPKYLMMALLKDYPDLLMYASDPTFFMGPTGSWLLITCFLWSSTATICRFFFHQSIYQIKLQYWIHPLTILENRDTIRDKHLRSIIKLTYSALKFVLIYGASASFPLYIPILIGLPIKYLPFSIVNSLITTFHAYTASAWEVNFIFLLAFYLYYSGLRFSKITSSFRRQFLSQIIYHNKSPVLNSTSYYDKSLHHFTQKVIKLAKEIDKAENFWYRVNNTVFMGTFLAETLLLYLVFFVNTEGAILWCCIFLGFLTFFYGQSINFILGIYLQYKFDEAVDEIYHWIHASSFISYQAKLKAMTVLDYLNDRHLFVVYWCVKTKTWNYIKVQAEVAMLLLLLIANSRR